MPLFHVHTFLALSVVLVFLFAFGDLERRIYRIDRLRLNPAGVPVRGALYFAALAAAAAALASLPLLGMSLSWLPWYVRDLVAPALLAALLTVVSVDGRPFHLAARSLLALGTGPRWLAGMEASPPGGKRWSPPELLVLADGSEGRPGRIRFVGPGAVLVAAPHERVEWARGRLGRRLGLPDVTLALLTGRRPMSRRRVVVLEQGVRLEVAGRWASGADS